MDTLEVLREARRVIASLVNPKHPLLGKIDEACEEIEKREAAAEHRAKNPPRHAVVDESAIARRAEEAAWRRLCASRDEAVMQLFSARREAERIRLASQHAVWEIRRAGYEDGIKEEYIRCNHEAYRRGIAIPPRQEGWQRTDMGVS